MPPVRIRGPVGLALRAALAAPLLLPLLARATVGRYSRFMGDDFCYAAVVSARGLLDAQRHWYMTWTGRFTANLAESLVGLAGPGGAPWIQALLLALFLSTLVLALWQLRPVASRDGSLWAAFILGPLLLSALFNGFPAVMEVLYWTSGATNYLLPLILGTAYGAVLFHYGRRAAPPAPNVVWLLAGAALTFLAGGASEIYGTLQAVSLLTALVLLASLGVPRSKRQALPIVLAGLAGAVLALVAVAVAPGNQVRQAALGQPSLSLGVLELALQLAWDSLVDATWAQPVVAAGLVALAALVGAGALAPAEAAHTQGQRGWLWACGWTPVITFALLTATFIVPVYALSGPPGARSLVIPRFAVLCALVTWGYAAGRSARLVSWPVRVRPAARLWQAATWGLVGLAAVNQLQQAAEILGQQPVYRAAAAAFDESERVIVTARARGIQRVSVAPLQNPGGFLEPNADPEFWVNECMRDYYGLTILAHAPLPAPPASELARITPLDASIGDAARVLGYALDVSQLREDGTLRVSVYWLPQAATDRPYTVFVQLLQPAGGGLAQVDIYPGQGRYPTTVWVYGRVFADTYQLKLPAGRRDHLDGELVLGLYDLETMARLPVAGRDTDVRNAWVRLGSVRLDP